MADQKRIDAAKARLKAANLRVLAAHQQVNADAHFRQAAHPIYPGQAGICTGKGNVIAAHAARTLAEADLIEAQI